MQAASQSAAAAKHACLMRRDVTRPSLPRCGRRPLETRRLRPHCGRGRGSWRRAARWRAVRPCGVAGVPNSRWWAAAMSDGCAGSVRIGRIKAVDESLGHRVKGHQRQPHHVRSGEQPGEAVVGVRGVVERRLELAERGDAVERGWRGGEPLRQGRVLLGDVVAVEAVEEGKAIAVASQQRLPGLPGRRHRDRRQRLQRPRPWAGSAASRRRAAPRARRPRHRS